MAVVCFTISRFVFLIAVLVEILLSILVPAGLDLIAELHETQLAISTRSEEKFFKHLEALDQIRDGFKCILIDTGMLKGVFQLSPLFGNNHSALLQLRYQSTSIKLSNSNLVYVAFIAAHSSFFCSLFDSLTM